MGDPDRIFGMEILVSPFVPEVPPSPGEVGRRIVRHGLADVLRWLGEPVGKRPDEPNHAVVIFQKGRFIAMHPEDYTQLRWEVLTAEPYHPRGDTVEMIWKAQYDYRRRTGY